MKESMKTVTLCFAVAYLLSTTANATLSSRLGGQAVYDSDLNITWLADANYAKTSGYDSDGLMNWNAAIDWASGLSVGGYSDWRLPTTLHPDPTCEVRTGSYFGDYSCTGSEMGHLFYVELGVVEKSSILTSSNPDLELFQNIQTDVYWSGTEYAIPSTLAWYFLMFVGSQNIESKDNSYYVWAVRDGDSSTVTNVPEPESYALVLAGLGLLGFARQRRKNLPA